MKNRVGQTDPIIRDKSNVKQGVKVTQRGNNPRNK